MIFRSALPLAWLLSCATSLLLLPSLSAETGSRPAVTIDEIAAGIEEHIAGQSAANGGFFKLQHDQKELELQLVRVHMEYLSYLGDGVSFACVDLVGTDGPVYDVDFFLKGPPGDMTVTATSVHKTNGQPHYAWKQKRDGSWRKVAASEAPPRLLGVLRGSDEFTFTYRARLPEMNGLGRLWLPIATSDAFQHVEIEKMTVPGQWRILDEHGFGNKILFIEAGPSDSGQDIEISYQVKRLEKGSYTGTAPAAEKHLAPEILVPTNETFHTIAEQLTRGKNNDLARARALYDHVTNKMRYARYGTGWGRGDAVYACDAQSGNCTDFHAYFIALARTSQTPARFAIGASIPSERNDGRTDGYHCWAEFFADGKWVPVDVSEANKNTRLADYFFGNQPANRFELSRGRDLVVDPQPASGPINFLAFPVMEIDGEPVNIRPDFEFYRQVQEPEIRRTSLKRLRSSMR